jgi:hypothetical protein
MRLAQTVGDRRGVISGLEARACLNTRVRRPHPMDGSGSRIALNCPE